MNACRAHICSNQRIEKPITPKEIAKAPSSAAEKEDGVLDN